MKNDSSKYYYRLRPICDTTIDELKNHYLWFSKRCGFRDKYDANIGAFLDNTDQILNGLERIFTKEGIYEFVHQMDKIGICCFSKSLPLRKNLNKFPNGKHSICIKYKVELIEDLFRNGSYAMQNPFHDVMYFEKPTIIEGDGKYHILREKTEDGCIYDSVLSIVHNPRDFEKLILMLLTRIDIKFKDQDETRIILGGRNLQGRNTTENGYRIKIPQESIESVFIYAPMIDDNFLARLKKIPYIANKIEMI